MTTQLPESTRQSQHQALQDHFKEMDGQLADIQQHHPDARLRTGASFTRSLLATRADTARASYKAGGNPSIDGHAGILASINGFVDKAKGALPPAPAATGASADAGQPPAANA